jgi:hypothetical protein
LQAAVLEPGVHEEDVLRQALTAANERSVMRAGGPVRVARFDPSGSRIVTGSRDGKVRVYDTGSSRPTLVMSQGAPVTAAEYSTDGRSLLTAGRNGQARLWTAKGKLRLTLNAGAPLRSAFFAVGTRAIVTLADGGLIQIWRTRDGRPLVTIKAVGKAAEACGCRPAWQISRHCRAGSVRGCTRSRQEGCSGYCLRVALFIARPSIPPGTGRHVRARCGPRVVRRRAAHPTTARTGSESPSLTRSSHRTESRQRGSRGQHGASVGGPHQFQVGAMFGIPRL